MLWVSSIKLILIYSIISNIKGSVSSHFQTQRRELKSVICSKYFWFAYSG